MKKVFHFLIYGNWLIALVATILTFGFSHMFSMENSLFNSLLIGFGTLFMYNFQRILSPFPPLKPFPNERFEWSITHKEMLKISALVGLITAAILSFLGLLYVQGILVLVLAVFLGIAYATPIPLIRKPLREIPYLKIHLIAIVWILSCFIFPQLNQEKILNFEWKIPFISYFYFLGSTIPFDMRDVENDYPSQKTIPQIIGLNGSKILSQFLLILFLGLQLYFVPMMRHNFVLVLAIFYQLFIIQLLKPHKSNDFYYSVWIDGGVLLLGLSYFFNNYI
jgi:hypothetical protein